MARLKAARRLQGLKNSLGYVRYLEGFPAFARTSVWDDIGGIPSRSDPKVYTVQTATEAIARCILMTTDPGDLVLDPTCGSGTTDNSRIALNIAKPRLMTATFPFYTLDDTEEGDRAARAPGRVGVPRGTPGVDVRGSAREAASPDARRSRQDAGTGRRDAHPTPEQPRAAYGHTSRPFPVKKGQKMAVRVVSQFGEETTKVRVA